MQQKIAANAYNKAEKAPTDTEKATLETKEAEEATVILLKHKKDSKEAIAKFQLEAEQGKAILKNQKEATEKK